MSYIMCYHKDEVIRRWGKQDVSLVNFRAANPDVPIVDGQWFQYDSEGENGSDRIHLINEKGGGDLVDVEDEYYINLVDSIKNPASADVGKVYPVNIPTDAYLELDDMQKTEPTNEGVPTGFTVDKGVQVWEYRDKTAEELIIDSNNVAKAAIRLLELSVSPRRWREAVLGTDNGWMASQDALIATERNKLQ